MTNIALLGSQSQGSQKVQCFTENLVHETLHFLGPHCIYMKVLTSATSDENVNNSISFLGIN